MTQSDPPGGPGAAGLSRRDVLSLGAGAATTALGLGALSGTAAAWRRFEVDFVGCGEVRILVDEDDLTLDPPAVARVVVAEGGQTDCRTVEVTDEAVTRMPDRYGSVPVLPYTVDDADLILGVIEYNYREDRFSGPVCVLANDNDCATGDDLPTLSEARCVRAGVEGYWDGEVRECWFDPLAVEGARDGASQRQRLAPDGLAAGDRFGAAIAVSDPGDVVLVGAPGGWRSDEPGTVYVYRREGDELVQTTALTVDDPDVNHLGSALALDASGTMALVGGEGGGEDAASGAVHVFEFDGDAWQRTDELLVRTDETLDFETVGGFGEALALDATGDTAVVGAPTSSRPGIHEGEAFVFERRDGGWTLEARGRQQFGEAIQFGHGVDLSAGGDRAAIGAPVFEWTSIDPEGWVRLLDRTADGWQPGARLVADHGELRRDLGYAVACDDACETVIAGDWRDDIDGRRDQGSATVFTQRDGSWEAARTLTASDGDAIDGFGSAVAASGDGSVALVGAPGAFSEPGDATDAAYCFEHEGDEWAQTAKLVPDSGARDDEFGEAVALDATGGTAVVGAPAATVEGVWSGAVYVYGLD